MWTKPQSTHLSPQTLVQAGRQRDSAHMVQFPAATLKLRANLTLSPLFLLALPAFCVWPYLLCLSDFTASPKPIQPLQILQTTSNNRAILFPETQAKESCSSWMNLR